MHHTACIQQVLHETVTRLPQATSYTLGELHGTALMLDEPWPIFQRYVQHYRLSIHQQVLKPETAFNKIRTKFESLFKVKRRTVSKSQMQESDARVIVHHVQ